MLEIIRRWGVEKRWVYGTLLGFVVIAFVGGMGMIGMSGPAGTYAAKVNGEYISATEFNNMYKSRYMEMERRYPEQWNQEMAERMQLKRQTLKAMVNQRLWLDMADRLAIRVSDAEVRDVLTSIPAFQVNNRFNSNQYKRVVARQHMSPEVFEASLRGDIRAQKARDLVAAAARVTQGDLAIFAQEDEGLEEAERMEREASRREAMLTMKQSQLVSAYEEYLFRKARIRLYTKNIGL